jgi:serine protease Do
VKGSAWALLATLAAALPAGASAGRPSPRPATAPAAAPFCSGEYADFLTVMNRETRTFEASPAAGYTYCVRTIATYEHVYYGKGGKLRRQFLRHVRHGTAFAYRARGGEWFLATNQHVTEHPLVTEADGEVEGVPVGSRKVREIVRIVANEGDEDEPSQIPLTKVLSDEALDLAVLKTRHPLKVMPYRIGRSSALRVGNAVQVRGYPLGVFAASNTGRVISVGQPDRERSWSHDDFAVDALLNAGNSGSPVFAVSCRTGELELVGIYHAGYKDAQGLNVVVSVDQLRGVLETLSPRPRDRSGGDAVVDHAAALERLRAAPRPFVMPFADRAVRVDLEGEDVRFSLLDADYPLTTAVQVAIVARGDLAQPAAFVVPSRFGERELPWPALDGSLRDPGQRLHDALWRQLAAVLAYRDGEARGGPEARTALSAAAARIRGRRGEQKEILQSIDFDADELSTSAAAAPAASEGVSPARVHTRLGDEEALDPPR